MYIYLSHLGSLYTSKKQLSNKELYCEDCGDYDEFIGEAKDLKEAWELMKGQTREFGSEDSRWWFTLSGIIRLLEENFNVEESDGCYVGLCAHVEDSRDNWYYFTRSKDVEELPIMFCPSQEEEVRDAVCSEMVNIIQWWNDDLQEFYCGIDNVEVLSWTYNNKLLYIYDVGFIYRDKNDCVTDGSEFNQAKYIDDGWYGWLGLNEMRFDENVKLGPWIKKILDIKEKENE